MPEVRSEAEIHCSAERIFDVIIDFLGQDRWLTKSAAFRGTSELSANPVTLGTTYREPGPLGVRNGTVTELERPAKIAFHQPMTLTLGAGTIDVVMRYGLTPRPGSMPASPTTTSPRPTVTPRRTVTPASRTATLVSRTVTLGIPRSLRLLQPLIVFSFRHESARTLLALKAYADTFEAPSPANAVSGVETQGPGQP
jgi:hypothetical protein